MGGAFVTVHKFNIEIYCQNDQQGVFISGSQRITHEAETCFCTVVLLDA